MAWAGLNQRQFPRVNTRCDILIHHRLGGAIQACTQNLGIGGACVILKQELEKLSTVRLRLTLKSEAAPIACEGRIVWIVRSKEPSSGKVTFDTGIEFLNLKLDEQERITSFIQDKV